MEVSLHCLLVNLCVHYTYRNSHIPRVLLLRMEAQAHPLSLSCQLQIYLKSPIGPPVPYLDVNGAQYLEYSLRDGSE